MKQWLDVNCERMNDKFSCCCAVHLHSSRVLNIAEIKDYSLRCLQVLGIDRYRRGICRSAREGAKFWILEPILELVHMKMHFDIDALIRIAQRFDIPAGRADLLVMYVTPNPVCYRPT